MNRKTKIVSIYLIGILCLALYITMKNSPDLIEFLEKAKRARIDRSFGVIAIIGLIELTLLVTGISTLVINSAFLIKAYFRSNSTNKNPG